PLGNHRELGSVLTSIVRTLNPARLIASTIPTGPPPTITTGTCRILRRPARMLLSTANYVVSIRSLLLSCRPPVHGTAANVIIARAFSVWAEHGRIRGVVGRRPRSRAGHG